MNPPALKKTQAVDCSRNSLLAERHSSPSQISSRTGDGRSSPLGNRSTGTSPTRPSSPSEHDARSPCVLSGERRQPATFMPRSSSPNTSDNERRGRSTEHRHRDSQNPSHNMIPDQLSSRRSHREPTREEHGRHTSRPPARGPGSYESNKLLQKRRRSCSQTPPQYKPIGYANTDAPARSTKPNQSDYISRTKALISKAIELYTIRIFTIDLFPGAMVGTEWATDDWRQVCNIAKQNFNPTDSHRVVKLIMNSVSSKRGHLKEKIDETGKETKTSNKKLVEYLQEGDSPRFCYKAYQIFNSDDLQFYAEPRIILRRIKDNLFKNAEDLGVRYRTAFDPIPVPLLAAGLTMLQYGLEIWASSQENPKLMFSEDGYKQKYVDHIEQLKKWTDINPEGVKAVRAQQYKRILRLASISLPQEDVAAGFSEDALQRAQWDLAARAQQGSDEESE
ncbi:hypothetical protein BC835DRAFT_1311512 [Cytidiella melzeri]|nr:hypothetical protein BC835DRAFT_1311512 [Cytidiella melzeri]